MINILLPTIFSNNWCYRKKGSRGSRESCEERGGWANRNRKGGRGRKGGRKVKEENTPASNPSENNNHNFIKKINAKDLEAEQPEKQL